MPRTGLPATLALSAAALLLATSSALAAAPSARYDTATLSPHARDGKTSSTLNIGNDRISAINVTLASLIEKAYGFPQACIFGLSAADVNERYDIEAKASGSVHESGKGHEMLRNLLTDRFHLKVHTETRTLPVYELVIAPRGVQFAPSAAHTGRNGITIDNNHLTAHEIPMSFLAKDLTDQVHRTVVDKTGLPGKYDLEFSWMPDKTAGSVREAINSALEKQAGLELKPADGELETLVVDHVELVAN